MNIKLSKELKGIKEYVESSKSENSKNELIFPFFKKIFYQNKFKREAEANGADAFIEGRLLIELKSKYEDWLAGFYQALHYHEKFGMNYSSVCVICRNFIGLWHIQNIPPDALKIITEADKSIAPNEIGKRNANKTNKALEKQILNSNRFLYDDTQTLYLDSKLLKFEDSLNSIDLLRNPINQHNFLRKIGDLKQFFINSKDPLDAIHCFYTILAFWDMTSKVPPARNAEPSILWVSAKNGSSASDEFIMQPKYHNDFRKFVEEHFVYTNEDEGITIDYYFSRFDEALAEHSPDYVKQHGIYFTDINLSKFALWFIREKYGEKKLSDKYIVIDPAGGSGNLISSWRRNHLKFKIVSELNPDLLKTIELRLKNDPIQIQQGYSIIPKTYENQGLNFIDKSAQNYYNIIEQYLKKEGKEIDKPFAFLLNPPYKNTDENVKDRTKHKAEYPIDESILSLSGNDASKERYILFLAQILEMCKIQADKSPSIEPIIMIFTPTPWLIPRPTFSHFRSIFDQYFKFEKGFMVNGKEFFKGIGRWPVSFTIWRFNQKKNKNRVVLLNLTELKSSALSTIPWNQNLDIINQEVKKILKGKKEVLFDNSRNDIRDSIPNIFSKNKNILVKNGRYNFYRNLNKEEIGKEIISGFPLKDIRHEKITAPHGFTDGSFVGFMDDNTPVRLRQEQLNRHSNKPDRLWCKLESSIVNANLPRIHSGPSDNRSYCALDVQTAKVLLEWYAITRAINGRYPVWVNQLYIWKISDQFDNHAMRSIFTELSFAYTLSDNICIVTKFEKDNPVIGAPEIFVDNPLCPTNTESFWSKTLDSEVNDIKAKSLVDEIKSLYDFWNVHYCRGQFIENCDLKDEAYFKYFDYPDFVTPYSGLIQIRKYAEVNGKTDIIERFEKIKLITKEVRERIYTLLVNDFKYFE